jgi:predicted nucleic acid-binding protein
LTHPKRVFLDANVLVAIGFRPRGEYSRILRIGGLVLVTSEHILRETAENLTDLGEDPAEFLAMLRQCIEITDRLTKLPVGLPLYDDENRQALAEGIGAHCDEFVTFNARDFKALYGQAVYGVYIRHSAEFLRVYSQAENPLG